MTCRGSVQIRTISNNIVIDNTNSGIYCETTPQYLDYNCVRNNYSAIEPGYPLRNYCGAAVAGAHDIDVDPLFVNADANDFHLLSIGGYWDSESQMWRDDGITVNSPCLDAGDPATNPATEAPYNGDRVNIGAYGNTWQASRTFLWGDATGDGRVDMQDVAAIAQNWLVGKQ